ncbi:hypothetical protein AGRA3207_002942 [Actinomadura graeca]|uniref:Uncharacterized protein n=1 Tax=Actinomadura graeca TaxID=2750812 RepID=A0ABX8QVJ8_9ACTN|nr:hypothetical protein [Actinomadura graeca]QXJ22014.1 hypothetical protein AGRA3207_002942 [Actinomadura graeca]
MPTGTYVHLDEGLEERFQCAPGPGGWRYTSRRSDGVRTDLVVDSRWRHIRVEIVTPSWWVRGGVTGPEVAWVRGAAGEGAAGQGERAGHTAKASGFLADSPAFLIATARSLGPDAEAGADLRLVQLAGTALAALTVTARWRLAATAAHETDIAPLPVAQYEIADLATGEVTAVHVAGDVLLAGPGIELAELDSPPNLPG